MVAAEAVGCSGADAAAPAPPLRAASAPMPLPDVLATVGADAVRDEVPSEAEAATAQ